MKKSTVSDIRKKRIGRPPVNAVPILVRMPPADLEPIDNWISKQKEALSRPEAIRRLVELGLAGRAKPAAAPSGKYAAKVKELAAKAIDRLVDPAAPAEEQAIRKRRLLKGPEAFREVRVDLPKKK
jgi:hypothetical protein